MAQAIIEKPISQGRKSSSLVELALRMVLVALPVLLVACTNATSPQPTQPSRRSVDFPALQASLEERIRTGSASLDNIRAVQLSVDGASKITHLRKGATAEESMHVWSVTKSVVATLVGIALGEGLITSLDQPLGELLPRQRGALSAQASAVTLHQLMTMSGGFLPDPKLGSDEPACGDFNTVKKVFDSGKDFVAYVLRQCHDPGMVGRFAYSNVSSHLVAAVLAEALRSAEEPRSILDYARAKLFDPLGIRSRPAFTKPVLEDDKEFDRAGFAWLTDPQRIQIGALGLRLTAADLLKLGELYLHNGVWDGKQILPVDWVRRVTQGEGALSEYGLMWWLETWNGHRVLLALGQGGNGSLGTFLIGVVPDQKLVVTITSASDQERGLDFELIFPLVRDLIIPALEGS